MIHDVEKLYDSIFDSINELVNTGEDPDRLFDSIIDHFAFMAEDGARRQQAYSALLNRFRDNDPILTIPEEPTEATAEVEKESEAIEWDVDEVPLDPRDKIDFFGNMNDINKAIMSEDADRFLSFLRKMDLPDTLEP